MNTTPIVLRIFADSTTYLCVDAPIAPPPSLLADNPRARWYKAHRLSREMGWKGDVCVRMGA